MKDIAIEAALSAGKVLMQRFGTALTVEHKGEIDLVTEVDRASEDVIVSVLRGTFPRHDILAEEGQYADSGSRYRWIVDPLDGTTNYAHGFPWFAVSIALEVENEVTLGVVYNPFSQELFWAEKGKGAFLNDVQIGVSRTGRLGDSLLATGFPYDRKKSDANNYDHFVHFQQAAQACRRPGSASLDLAYVGAGRLDGYWEMKLKPWDVAAGQLIVSEASGRVSDFDGDPFDIYGVECLASNGRIHQEMIDVLKAGKRPA